MNDMKNEKTSEEIFREQRFAEIRPTIINTNMIETNYEVDNLTATAWYELFQETIIHNNQSKSYENFTAYLDDHIAWHDEGEVWLDFENFVEHRVKFGKPKTNPHGTN